MVDGGPGAQSTNTQRAPEPMKVVLDTNIIFGHRHLRGPTIDLLMKYIRQTGSVLVVPELVFHEVTKQFRADVGGMLSGVESAIRKLNGFVGYDSGAKPSRLAPEDAIRAYAKALAKRLRELGVQRPCYKGIPIEDVIDRALRERRPFTGEDRGVRDAVIWETILRHVVSKGQKVVFITNDGGFADKQGNLHPDLQADLVTLGLPSDAVQIAKSLEEFNATWTSLLPPDLSMDAIVKGLFSGTYGGFSPSSFIESKTDDLTEAAEEHIDVLLGDAAALYGYLRQLEEPTEVVELSLDSPNAKVADAEEVDCKRVFVQLSVPCQLTIDGFLPKSEAHWISARVPISVQDYDWNDRYMWVYITVEAVMTVNVTLEANTGQVESFEVESLVPVDPEWEEMDDQPE